MSNYRNVVLWIIAGLFVITLFNVFQGGRNHVDGPALTYSEFLTNIDSGNIQEVVIRGNVITGQLQDGRSFSTFSPPQDPNLIEKLNNKKIKFSAAPNESNNISLLDHLLSWAPMLIIAGIWIFFLRQMQSGNNKAMGFGKSKARLLNEQKQKITFADVAGVEEAKQEVQEIIEFLKDPPKFQKLGGKIPKGVLLVGSPGTGKTLLARAIAGEANVPFFSISGSDFVEMFVGVGASRVRDLFEQGKKNAPCIIFIDEIDAVGRHRGVGMGGGNDEREQTLNQLLVEMDGFEANEGVILIAATNRPDVLDPALIRPGRFDRQVIVSLPSVAGREEILNVHMVRVPISTDVDVKVIARGTPGFSGADLANLVNEAALLAARHNKRVVTQSDFESAKDKILMGSERRSMVMSDEEKKLTAYHEGGHAIIAHNLAASDPIHKATIIPRGRALGMVTLLPEGDRTSTTRAKLKASLAIAFGGRVAEEIIFGDDKVTTGASSDIHNATNIARNMVTKWGLSQLGPIEYGNSESENAYSGSASKYNYSEETARKVDEQVKFIVDEAYNVAHQILTKHLDDLHILANTLLEHETLTGEEITQLLTTKTFKKNVNTEIKKNKPRSTAPRAKVKKTDKVTPSSTDH